MTQEKHALITGASRGIGRAIALKLAEQGYSITLNYVRNEDAAQATAKEIEALGVKTAVIQANVGDEKEVKSLVKQSIDLLGNPDVMVHNAAMGSFKPTHKIRLNQWDLTFDINTRAFIALVREVLPFMEEKKKGSIIGLSSLGSGRYIPNYGAIGISKAALESTIRYLAVELIEKGIRVNGVSGGPIDTDAIKFFPDYDEFKAECIKKTPAGRIGTPEDIAKVVSFLISPEANWIVGQTLIADGGLSLI